MPGDPASVVETGGLELGLREDLGSRKGVANPSPMTRPGLTSTCFPFSGSGGGDDDSVPARVLGSEQCEVGCVQWVVAGNEGSYAD